ncbi:N-acetylmuramoyl-L-alanine amidase [Paracoccus gahaiensis]|uniref:N-acetylmuramoyl-L-alanine amidase n=1 Tax=Paracoccus gahaiensis TaxID=1706839 RepID=A0A4V5MVQ0_9RHOB|nr:N-acetylmuramoyl-L-alanine amidase [Paracoccus gahaiensis]TJZ93078.1 N-acetylmuramoyl-L-alanine amidase [Paracoccus gahaiensis]
MPGTTGLSPNHGDRRGHRPSLIVLHYTGMADAASARARLCEPAAEVSAHWLIAEDGTTEALVCETRRAWHAGAGGWQGADDLNSRSIGIELANPGDRPFPTPQMAALRTLLHAIMARWQIPPSGVIAHSDLAPGRKIDPGPRFDWEGLARDGLAVFARLALSDRDLPPGPPLPALLDALGYPATDDPALRLHAFRLRHSPWAQGPETPDDRRLALRLLQRSENIPGESPLGDGGSAPS